MLVFRERYGIFRIDRALAFIVTIRSDVPIKSSRLPTYAQFANGRGAGLAASRRLVAFAERATDLPIVAGTRRIAKRVREERNRPRLRYSGKDG